MSYAFSLTKLLSVLEPHAPLRTRILFQEKRQVEHGLLSVGLKIHYIGDIEPFEQFISDLGGAGKVLEQNYYRRTHAAFTLVLPPIGSARSAITLLECIEQATGVKIFNSKDVQIQVCSPGRLSPPRAALLAIAFYLGSDIIRRYTLGDFQTTFSSAETMPELLKKHERGRRLVLYDADWGKFDRRFAWWIYGRGRLRRSRLPFTHERTDMISAKSKIDIHNINLAATLLCHAQFDGYWSHLGEEFHDCTRTILQNHMLDELLYAPWVHEEGVWEDAHRSDEEFILAFGQLMNYAIQDSFRVRKEGRKPGQPLGILGEVKTLLKNFRTKLEEESLRAQGREQ